MGNDSSDCKELVALSAAERRLAECTDLEEVLQIRDEAEVVRSLLKKQRRGLHAQNRAAKLKVQAERRVGAQLIKMNLNGGDRKSVSHDARLILTLKKMGLNYSQSSRWQQEASLSDEEFEALFREIDSAGQEFSSQAVLRFVRRSARRPVERPKGPARTRCVECRNEPASLAAWEETYQELLLHFETVRRMVSSICQSSTVQLKDVERQEIPRYLRETMVCLERMDTHFREDRD